MSNCTSSAGRPVATLRPTRLNEQQSHDQTAGRIRMTAHQQPRWPYLAVAAVGVLDPSLPVKPLTHAANREAIVGVERAGES
jgi:hypothetical protein